MKYAISLVALLAAVGAANAADLIIDAPTEPAVAASGIRGVVEVGALGIYADQTDDDFAGSAAGGYAAAAIWGMSDSLVWGIDGYVEANSFGGLENEAPTYVGVVGGHLGFNTGSGSIGAFGSVGFAPDENDDAKAGYTVGVEGIADLGGLSLFGQLGYGNVRVDEDDSGFTGPFVRVGALYALSDDLAVMADLSAGTSQNFEDPDDDGAFLAAGVKAAFALPTDFDAFLTAGYEFAHYQANTEDDGYTHAFKVGVSIPFGDGNTAATALNPLATSALPYRAASWGEALD